VRVRTTTQIASPPEQVFDTLADLRNDAKWHSRVSSVELLDPEPIGQGTRFKMVNGGSPYDVTIAEYDRPSRLVIEASGKPDLTLVYTLKPTSEGTELESDFDFRPKGALKVMLPLFSPIIRREVPKQNASLKAFCER
jgi:uncharacterized protein YndB with AHSA1/START domain